MNLMLFLIERSVMAGCISEIPSWNEFLSTELPTSSDPSPSEVSSPAQGIAMSQIITWISEKLAFYIPLSQAWMWRWKGIILLFGTGYSLMLIILQLLLSTICCIPMSALMEALLRSSSPPPSLYQLIFWPQLWFDYNSLQICCDAVYIFCSKQTPSAQPLFQLAGTLFCWNLEIDADIYWHQSWKQWS